MDEDIYKQFREDFKDLKVDVLQEDDIKSEANKQVCAFAVSLIFCLSILTIDSKHMYIFPSGNYRHQL